MRRIIATITGISAYSQSKNHETPKLDRELADAYELRTWREKLHTNEAGNVLIPPTAFKNGLASTAKFLSEQIPGKGKQTYTKHFESGVLVVEALILPVHKDQVQSERLFVPSDGRRGGGKRVWKYFPVIPQWGGDVVFYLLDDIITKTVFDKHLDAMGKFIGLGRFRPQNNGYYGRFNVAESVEVKE
jgi:hypothetical protein